VRNSAETLHPFDRDLVMLYWTCPSRFSGDVAVQSSRRHEVLPVRRPSAHPRVTDPAQWLPGELRATRSSDGISAVEHRGGSFSLTSSYKMHAHQIDENTIALGGCASRRRC